MTTLHTCLNVLCNQVDVHNRKRLLDVLFWLVETSQPSITVRIVANSRCLLDMYI